MIHLVGNLYIESKYGYKQFLGVQSSVCIDELEEDLGELKEGVTPQEYFEQFVLKSLETIKGVLFEANEYNLSSIEEIKVILHIENREDIEEDEFDEFEEDEF